MKRYNKIVRDNIPEIIQLTGKTYTIETVKNVEAIKFLIAKLHEETNELSKNFCAEEIADLKEVLDAIIEKSKFEKVEIEKVRRDKHKERGGFEKNIILKLVK